MILTRRISLTIVLMLIAGVGLIAQCPMCRIAAESNLEHGGTAGQGLNTGILYMLSMPYLIVMLIGYLWYRNKKTDVDSLEEQLQAETA